MKIAANAFPIMPVLCLTLSVTHYAQNYAGMIVGSLYVTALCAVQASENLDCTITKSSYIYRDPPIMSGNFDHACSFIRD